MLAAHTTTGDWIVGGIALVVGLAIIAGIVWLLYRLVTWPARRRRRAGGLGSDYEQMIRQQKRGRPVAGGGDPPYWPPPQGSATPQPQVTAESTGRDMPPPQSRVVLPPPPYRPREEEAPEPEPTAPTVSADPTPAPSAWRRLMWRPVRIPPWALTSLAWLGVCFVLLVPFGMDWFKYGAALVVAVLVVVWTRRNFHSRILWRSKSELVSWQRWGKGDLPAEPPVVVTPMVEDLPTPTPTETPPSTPIS
jgi:hypothetical protein